MGTTAGQFISALTEDHDVIVIGGLAVIAHGFNRPTMDAQDITFLESKVRSLWVARLPTADLAEAIAMFDRFVDWRTCEAALTNPDSAVTEIAMGYLREFAADGDPFSQALLANAPVPPA